MFMWANLLLTSQLEPLSYRRMDFEEFCAATISPYQLEALEEWEQMATTAFRYFEEEGNRVISVVELAQVLTSWLFARGLSFVLQIMLHTFAGNEPCPSGLFYGAWLDTTCRWKAQFSWLHQIFAWCDDTQLQNKIRQLNSKSQFILIVFVHVIHPIWNFACFFGWSFLLCSFYNFVENVLYKTIVIINCKCAYMGSSMNRLKNSMKQIHRSIDPSYHQ